MARPEGLAAAVGRNASLKAAEPPADAEQVTQRRDGDVLEARSTSSRIRTVEDLLTHIEADMSVMELAASEATKWECASRAPDGTVSVTELHRVWVRLKPRPGPSVRECVAALVEAASRPLAAAAKPIKPRRRSGSCWAVQVMADVHFGKYAWHGSTGGPDYDLTIADRVVRQATEELLEASECYRPARRTIALLGDIFHYDTVGGTTTGGTQLDRDGRIQKMLQLGCEAVITTVERSAATCPTDVIVVNGNHDEALTWSLHRILLERFRRHKSVRIDAGYTSRKYSSFGRNLLGFAHGHKAKARLPQIMALEAADRWAACPQREIHTGHYHSTAAAWSRPIESIDGVLVRTAPAICPPDQWTSESGFVGSRQAMELFLYDRDTGFAAMHVATPRWEQT